MADSCWSNSAAGSGSVSAHSGKLECRCRLPAPVSRFNNQPSGGHVRRRPAAERRAVVAERHLAAAGERVRAKAGGRAEEVEGAPGRRVRPEVSGPVQWEWPVLRVRLRLLPWVRFT